jgi:hypothetical protein
MICLMLHCMQAESLLQVPDWPFQACHAGKAEGLKEAWDLQT